MHAALRKALIEPFLARIEPGWRPTAAKYNIGIIWKRWDSHSLAESPDLKLTDKNSLLGGVLYRERGLRVKRGIGKNSPFHSTAIGESGLV